MNPKNEICFSEKINFSCAIFNVCVHQEIDVGSSIFQW